MDLKLSELDYSNQNPNLPISATQTKFWYDPANRDKDNYSYQVYINVD